MLKLLSPLDDKLVLMGMSCVGKTTLASSLVREGYVLHSFDYRYKYHLSGLPGVGKRRQWEKIIGDCVEPRFVLDNWTTEDRLGGILFDKCPDACLVVLFAGLADILKRYRVPVKGKDAHKTMYDKIYRSTPFEEYPKVRFVEVVGGRYLEHTLSGFRERIRCMDEECGMVFDVNEWTWKNI